MNQIVSKSFLAGVKALSHRETDDTYLNVLYQKDNWRIIICRDGKQWIVQKAKISGVGHVWEARSFCTTRKALIRVWHAKTGDYHGTVELTKNLPETIGGVV